MLLNKNQMQLFINFIYEIGEHAIFLRDNKQLNVNHKHDGTYVTDADLFLDQQLSSYILNNISTQYPIVSEEQVERGYCPLVDHDEGFWCIDPLDSTTSFISGGQYYSMNVAFIHKKQPILGIIYAPDLKTCWYAEHSLGAFKQVNQGEVKAINVREMDRNNVTVIMPDEQKLEDQMIQDGLKLNDIIRISSAIKWAYIAEGRADYYSRKRNKACDWDIAAGHALVNIAGGSVDFMCPEENFCYGNKPYLAPSLVVYGKMN